MCEMLGSEPVEEEIPCTREDLAVETQMVLNLYDKLQANWEGMSGQYLGKNLMLLPTLFDEFEFDVSMRKYAWFIIPIMDAYVAEDIAKKIKAKSKQGDLPRG